MMVLESAETVTHSTLVAQLFCGVNVPSWQPPKLCPNCAPIMFQSCFNYVSTMVQLCFNYVSTMFQICFNYDLTMISLSNYVPALQLCLNCVSTMFRLCNYVPTMLQLCFNYVSSMFQLCSNNLLMTSRATPPDIFFLNASV